MWDSFSYSSKVWNIGCLCSSGLRKYSRRLGHELAKLHQHNISLGLQAKKLENTVTKPPQATPSEYVEDGGPPKYVTQFGFHTSTCCGYIPQENSWSDDWLVSSMLSIERSSWQEVLYMPFSFQTFFAQQRLQHQFNLLEKDVSLHKKCMGYGNVVCCVTWNQ